MSTLPVEELQGRVSFQDWKELFDRLTPAAVAEICADAIRKQLGVPESINFYAAGIDRLRNMAHMAIALSDDERSAANEFSDAVLRYVHARFTGYPEKLERLNAAISYSDDYYRAFGTGTARQLGYDLGLYNEYGVELDSTVSRDPTDRPS